MPVASEDQNVSWRWMEARVGTQAYALVAWTLTYPSSDGDWEQEWRKVRNLYLLLWPDDRLQCPWQEDSPASTDIQAIDLNSTGLTATNLAQQYQSDLTSSSTRLRQRFTTREPVIHSRLSLDEAKTIRVVLSQCSSDVDGHVHCVPKALEWEPRPGVNFRLIDTLRGCIVVDPLTSESYAALSRLTL